MGKFYPPNLWRQRVNAGGRPNMNVNPSTHAHLFAKDQVPGSRGTPNCVGCKRPGHTLVTCTKVKWNASAKPRQRTGLSTMLCMMQTRTEANTDIEIESRHQDLNTLAATTRNQAQKKSKKPSYRDEPILRRKGTAPHNGVRYGGSRRERPNSK
eukprot:SAG11_NODE_1092_length_5910_cov_3.131303_3_plen_154_part_00